LSTLRGKSPQHEQMDRACLFSITQNLNSLHHSEHSWVVCPKTSINICGRGSSGASRLFEHGHGAKNRRGSSSHADINKLACIVSTIEAGKMLRLEDHCSMTIEIDRWDRQRNAAASINAVHRALTERLLQRGAKSIIALLQAEP